MPDPRIFLDMNDNTITADPKQFTNIRAITVSEVPMLVKAGATLDDSARALNLKTTDE